MFFLLGAGERLVGNTIYCVRPSAAREKVKVGTVMQVSLEKIISLKPDLILTTGLTQQKQIIRLRQLGFRVVHFNQPKSFAESCEQFLELGRVLGLEEKAAMIIDQIQKEVDIIKHAVAGYKKPRVLLQIGAVPLYVSGADSFTGDYIELGGGINGIGTGISGKINYEQAIAADPEVIIIAIMGSETGVAAEEKIKWQKYTVISAVQTGRIHIVDPDLACSPSPATFLQALKIITGHLHPQADFQEVR